MDEYKPGLIDWVKKAISEQGRSCMLVPAYPGAKWFQTAVKGGARVFFLQGRLKFCVDGIPGDSAPFDSALLLFNWNLHSSQIAALEARGFVC